MKLCWVDTLCESHASTGCNDAYVVQLLDGSWIYILEGSTYYIKRYGWTTREEAEEAAEIELGKGLEQ
jgi:hypothetical protein